MHAADAVRTIRAGANEPPHLRSRRRVHPRPLQQPAIAISIIQLGGQTMALKRLLRMSPFPRCPLLGVLAFALVPLTAAAQGVVYSGADGPGKGKHVVLISGDEEYRSEETLPQLGKIL